MILGIFTLVNVKVRKEGDGPFVRSLHISNHLFELVNKGEILDCLW